MYTQTRGRTKHVHKYFVDKNSNDVICLCGKVRGEKRLPKGTGVNKYHSSSAMYNGHHYDSIFEANYAYELDMRVRAHDILSWERQVKLDLTVNGLHITNYYIDFVVKKNDGSYEWVECKGFEQDLWKVKWKLFETLFDEFKRTPDDRMLVVKQDRMAWR